MGDTAPAGGLGLRAPGAGLLGGGLVTPQVHSAIVERLRARITVCRQHHLSCQGRYERSRAENSDRERESTLQLLNVAQHGQSTGSRKSGGKPSKAAAAAAAALAPPDYPRPSTESGGLNGDQQLLRAPPGDQRSSALIALQGSLKRKLVVNLSPTNESLNCIPDGSSLDIKKMRLNNNLSIGQSGQHVNSQQNQARAIPMGQELHTKASNIANNVHGDGNDIFNMTLKDIKKEPGETMSCSKHLDGHLSQENMFPNRYDDMSEHMMDPELQELFNELTSMSVSPVSDLELQNMINITIKQDEPFSIDIGQQNQRNTPRSSLLLEKAVIKSEYSPGLNQAHAGSPQMRPSSAGPSFSMSNAVMSTSPVTSVPQTQTPRQVSSSSNCPLSGWQEISHAEQLKQIAANRQQHAMIQQHQQNQPSNWSRLSSSGPSSRSFGPEKVPSPSFRQQQFDPQSSTISGIPINGNQTKEMNNYLYKPTNSNPHNNHIDIMMQQKAQDPSRGLMGNTYTPAEHHSNPKPLFHFNSEQKKQQTPSVLGSQSKPSILHYTAQQSSVASQQQQPPQPLQSHPHQRPPNVLLPLQQKLMLQKLQQNQQFSRLQYPLSQHQQEQHCMGSQSTGPSSTPGACSNPNSGSGYLKSSQQSAFNQQLMERKQVLQKQFLPQQQILAETDKIAPQDQLNRHLTRPPPDYKDQRRNMVNMQQTNQYLGGSPTGNINGNQILTTPVSTHNMLPQNPGLLSTNQGTRVPSLPGAQHVGLYGNISCNQSVYSVAPGVSQMQQPNTQTQIGSSQNNPTASRQSALGQGNSPASFGSEATSKSKQVRPGLNHGATSMAGQRSSNVIISSNAPSQIWTSSETTKQETLKLASVCFPASIPYSDQSMQTTVGNQHFAHRAVAPPNQFTPTMQIRPVNPMNQVLNGQIVGSLRGIPSRPSQLRAQTAPGMNQLGTSVNQTNSFTPSNQNPKSFSGTDSSSELGFDFLSQQSDNLGSALNSDPDFIDCLLKTGPSSDDWMKDINLDEILGNTS